MAHNMYNPGGGLNVFWVDEDMERIRKEKIKEEMQFYKDLEREFRDSNSSDIDYELEAKFEFLKKHSDNPEDLELAKKILGIN